MATLKSDLITDLDRTPAVKRVNRNQVERIDASYEAASPGGGPHTLNMWRVQRGDRVVDGRLDWDALGGGTLTVGDSDDTDRFMTTRQTARASNNYNSGLGSGGSNRFDVVYTPTTFTLKADGTLDNCTVDGAGCGYVYTCEKDIAVSIEGINPSGTIWGYIDVVRAAPTQ